MAGKDQWIEPNLRLFTPNCQASVKTKGYFNVAFRTISDKSIFWLRLLPIGYFRMSTLPTLGKCDNRFMSLATYNNESTNDQEGSLLTQGSLFSLLVYDGNKNDPYRLVRVKLILLVDIFLIHADSKFSTPLLIELNQTTMPSMSLT